MRTCNMQQPQQQEIYTKARCLRVRYISALHVTCGSGSGMRDVDCYKYKARRVDCPLLCHTSQHMPLAISRHSAFTHKSSSEVRSDIAWFWISANRIWDLRSVFGNFANQNKSRPRDPDLDLKDADSYMLSSVTPPPPVAFLK